MRRYKKNYPKTCQIYRLF